MAIECPAVDGSSPRQTQFSEPPPMCIDPAKRYTAEVVTSLGTLVIALDAVCGKNHSYMPITVKVVNQDAYDTLAELGDRRVRRHAARGGSPCGRGRRRGTRTRRGARRRGPCGSARARCACAGRTARG